MSTGDLPIFYNMIKIACIGAPSTGKSSTIDELKKLSKKNVIEYISAGQFLKANGFSINEEGTEVTGKVCVFFHKLSMKTFDLLSSEDVVVLPRTIIDPIAYDDVPVSEEEVKEYFSTVDLIYYFPIEVDLVERENRTKSVEFQKRIDKKLLDLCEKYHIKYETLSGTPKEKAEKILPRI